MIEKLELNVHCSPCLNKAYFKSFANNIGKGWSILSFPFMSMNLNVLKALRASLSV